MSVQARGTGASGGELQRFSSREADDGKMIVDWAARRVAGSDGRVALVGCSYPGVIALNTAARVGPTSPVKAVIAACAGLSLNRATLMVAGMPTTSFWNFITRGQKSMGSTPAAARFFSKMEADMKAGGDVAYERAFWLDRGNLSLTRSIAANDIPVLLWAGWRDTNNAVALRTFTGLQNAYVKRPFGAPMDPGQSVTPRYQIIMGSWTHGGGLDRGIFLQWFETWVKGVDTGIQATSTPMHIHEPGTDRWINLSRYPVTSEHTAWHFAGSGTLAAGRVSAGSEKIVLGDPSHPGAKLAFTTPPFTVGATLSGPMSATVFASSSNTNMLLIAKLYDQGPDGASVLFSTGIVLGSQHKPDPALSWSIAAGQ